MKNEFSLIKKIIDLSEDNTLNNPALIVPPGDDAALLKALKRPVISTDTQRENVHFKREWLSPGEIGYKAVMVTLSDLAASYASPVALFINLGVPGYLSDDYIEKLYLGLNDALTRCGCALGGGNISSSEVLSLDLFAVGSGDDSLFPLRSNAEKGNGLYVTGQIGLARAGLDALQRGTTMFSSLTEAFKKPKARFDASDILKSHNVTCLMDISDGLCGDAMHIAEDSGLSIEFSLAEHVLSDDLTRYCQEFNLSAVDMALAGGEDYELLFTCSHETFIQIEKELPGAFKVGNCLEFNGSPIINPPEDFHSYVHA